ncbi:LysR family transcriptional regulator [Paraherbaspirillum soli]|uniref:LysR substrate-binding domain-containing protein n=1 Tax=Paraherbaspirillum soli TaxID=631222 RepID=A0ABW0M428_9BURK
MRLFVDASMLGSFSAAGRKHGLSPAASSACIQRLEATLRVKLFERTTRQLRLTEEGQLYKLYCQQALELMDEAEQALQAGKSLVQGTVRISAPSDLGRNVLLDYLDEFQRQYPQVQFALSLTDSTANLVQDDVDLAIRYGVPPDSGMVARPLMANRRVVCVAPECAARVGLPQTPEQLSEFPALVLVTAAGPMNEWRYRQGGKSKSVRLSRYQQSNDGEVIRKWALRGQGYAYKSLLDISEDLRAGRLQTVLDDFFTDSVPLNVLYHRSSFRPPRVKLLIEFLQDRFAGTASQSASAG